MEIVKYQLCEFIARQVLDNLVPHGIPNVQNTKVVIRDRTTTAIQISVQRDGAPPRYFEIRVSEKI